MDRRTDLKADFVVNDRITRIEKISPSRYRVQPWTTWKIEFITNTQIPFDGADVYNRFSTAVRKAVATAPSSPSNPNTSADTLGPGEFWCRGKTDSRQRRPTSYGDAAQSCYQSVHSTSQCKKHSGAARV